MSSGMSKPQDVSPKDVGAYLATVPEEARATLEELRRTVHVAAPGVTESISYGLPAFKYHGRPLVYIGAAKKHVGLYAITTSIQEAYRDELKDYETSKGTIRFPIGKPLPGQLIEKLVKARIGEIEAQRSK